MQRKFPHARFRDNPTGLFYTKTGSPIKINKPGTPDIEMRLPTDRGIIVFEYEIKSGKGKQSKVQKRWQKNTESMNGFYCIVRDDFEEVFEKTLEYINLNDINFSVS